MRRFDLFSMGLQYSRRSLCGRAADAKVNPEEVAGVAESCDLLRLDGGLIAAAYRSGRAVAFLANAIAENRMMRVSARLILVTSLSRQVQRSRKPGTLGQEAAPRRWNVRRAVDPGQGTVGHKADRSHWPGPIDRRLCEGLPSPARSRCRIEQFRPGESSRLSRNHNPGHTRLIAFLERLTQEASWLNSLSSSATAAQQCC